MIPLTFASIGEEALIKKISGKSTVRQHLNTLGFTEGSKIAILSKSNGNLIIKIKGSRIAISKELATKIVIH